MASKARAINAFQAMKKIGIPGHKVKPVLKRLLQTYDRNWDLIEGENYRVLADAIFDEDDSKEGGGEIEEPMVDDKPDWPQKRYRLIDEEEPASESPNDCSPIPVGIPLKKPKVEVETASDANLLQRSPNLRNSQPEHLSPENHNSQMPLVRDSNKGKEPMYAEAAFVEKRPNVKKPSLAIQIREPVDDQDKPKMSESHPFVKPAEEPLTDNSCPDELIHNEAPIAVIQPDPSPSPRSLTTDALEIPESNLAAERNGDDSIPVPPLSSEKRTNSKPVAVQDESPLNLEIAASSSGEVKVSVNCDSLLGRANFRMPSRDELLKLVQEKYVQRYKITDPNFSVLQILKDMCDSLLEMRADSSMNPQKAQ